MAHKPLAEHLRGEWSDERKISALVVVATAKKLSKEMYFLEDEQHALVVDALRQCWAGKHEQVKHKLMIDTLAYGDLLARAIGHALDLALRGLRDLPGAGQPTQLEEVRRFPLDLLPCTLFYYVDAPKKTVHPLIVAKEKAVHRLNTAEWIEKEIARLAGS